MQMFDCNGLETIAMMTPGKMGSTRKVKIYIERQCNHMSVTQILLYVYIVQPISKNKQ